MMFSNKNNVEQCLYLHVIAYMMRLLNVCITSTVVVDTQGHTLALTVHIIAAVCMCALHVDVSE